MEQLKQSENEILDLGNKIVKQLDLKKRSDTTAKWMAHYVAELISNIESCKNPEEKKEMQQECSQLIFKLWKNKKFLPIDQPLSDLKPLLKILEGLSTRQFHFSPFFPKENDLKNIDWFEFAMLVKKNSIDIFEIIVFANSANEIIEHRKKSTDDSLPLFKHESNIMSLLSSNLENKSSIIRFGEERLEYEKLNSEEAKKIVFDRLESLLDEQKNAIIQLRNKLM